MLRHLLEVLAVFLIVFVCNGPGILKYIIVSTISVAFLYLGRKKRWSVEILLRVSLPGIVYLLIGGFYAIINANAQVSTVKNMVFWIVPLMFAFSLYVYYGKKLNAIVNIMFLCCGLIYLVPNIRFIIENGAAEATFAFVFGLFMIYYTYGQQWGLFGLCAILLYFSDKRIVYIAVIVAVLVLFVIKLFRNDKRIAIAIWASVVIGTLLYVWLICSGTMQGICQGIGINTNGRMKIYDAIIEHFGDTFILFGRGLGNVELILEGWNIYAFRNLHNDILKFYIELGLIGLILFLLSYGIIFYWSERRGKSEEMSFLLANTVYSMVLFATDNVSIYILYLIPMYSIIFAVLSRKEIK